MKLLLKLLNKPLIVDALTFHEVELELLTISGNLGCQSVSLSLQLLLAYILVFQLIEFTLKLNNFRVGVLVIQNVLLQSDLLLRYSGVVLELLGLALPAIDLQVTRHVHLLVIARLAL